MPPVTLGSYIWFLCYSPYVRLNCIQLAISRVTVYTAVTNVLSMFSMLLE